jgi:hypothetical protein
MAINNIDDVAHCEKSLQTLNEGSGDQLYRYYRFHVLELDKDFLEFIDLHETPKIFYRPVI